MGFVCLYVCVGVFVCKKERRGEGDGKGEIITKIGKEKVEK